MGTSGREWRKEVTSWRRSAERSPQFFIGFDVQLLHALARLPVHS